MLLLHKPAREELEHLRELQVAARPSYDAVGATRAKEMPPGYRHDRYEVVLGDGDAAFERGVEGLRRWQAHAGTGVEITPPHAPIAEGETVLFVLRIALLHVVGACRIVYVIDERDRFGFAYATLPVHPEKGEESFVVERDDLGRVRFTITAFSRPVDILARLAGPASRTIQRRVTKGYLRALQRFVADGRQ